MGRGPLYQRDFRPQFSGHETFPLRYGWLKKVYDAISLTENGRENNKAVFLADDAIAKFGVGKNMVSSMRYWAIAAGVIKDESNNSKGPYLTTDLGKRLLSDDGWDPFLEEPASLWFLHWQFAGHPKPTTTWYYVFNHFNGSTFHREQLIEQLQQYCSERGVTGFAAFTLKRDVECFVRTYATRVGQSEEEALESLLSELALLQSLGKRDGYLIRRGPKPSLPDSVFMYALAEYISQTSGQRSFSVETLTHEPGSPGRTFLLDEESLVSRLSRADELTKGKITWSETAGLRQIFLQEEITESAKLKLLGDAYRSPKRKRAA